MTSYRDEFPDFPAADMPAIPEGFTDQSWHNDVCPHFIHEASGVVIWIDYADPAQREIPAYERFRVQQCVDLDPDRGWLAGGGELELFETDDWAVVERSLPHFIADMPDEIAESATPAQAARMIRMRLNLLTPGDARALLAEEAAVAHPCPETMAMLAQIIEAAAAMPAKEPEQ